MFLKVGLDQQTVTVVCTNRRRKFLLDTADSSLTTWVSLYIIVICFVRLRLITISDTLRLLYYSEQPILISTRHQYVSVINAQLSEFMDKQAVALFCNNEVKTMRCIIICRTNFSPVCRSVYVCVSARLSRSLHTNWQPHLFSCHSMMLYHESRLFWLFDVSSRVVCGRWTVCVQKLNLFSMCFKDVMLQESVKLV